MALRANDTLGSYIILGPIGRGGMGEVYRARDPRLERDVAIKVLPDSLSESEASRERFHREARAVAALSHPNILAIHELGEDNDVAYAVMELLEGETLRARLAGGKLSSQRAVAIAAQIARGLGAAHEKGIVHRDLKPENVFLTRDDQVKLLDFGLAKIDTKGAAEPGGSESPTMTQQSSPGSLVGTVGYMSPEQLRGESVDARADLFALGAVLFEMLTGERAFEKETAAVTMSAILTEDPLERAVGKKLPPELLRILHRLLEKKPWERFQSARDLDFALDTKTVAAPDASGSIAVLPFSNMSSDLEQEYFCEGMAEEIINALARIPGLRVTSRMSAFQFKADAGDIREIGDALNVKTVLEGSVRSSGKRLRVTAQLINVEDGYHLWSERYDRDMEDVFAIQDEIATHIVSALKPKLLGEKPTSEKKRHTDDVEAYQLYLKGQHNWYKRYKDSLTRAANYFEKATERDPDYALAHAGVADAYTSLGIYGLEPSLAGEKARAAADRALALNDGLAETQASRAFVRYFYDWEWEGAERGFRHALGLNPSYVLPYCWYQFLLCTLGRSDEAVAVMRRAQEQDPLSPYVNALAGAATLASGDVDAALVELEKALDVDEHSLLAIYTCGIAYSKGGQHERAVAAFDKAALLAARAPYYVGLMGWGYARAGLLTQAEGVLEELFHRAESEYVSPLFFVWVFGGLGRTDESFEMLEKAYQEHNPSLALHYYPWFDEIRSEPRFADMLRRIGLGDR